MSEPGFSKTRCRSCEAPIVWAVTMAGRRMPLDKDPRPDGNMFLFSHGDTLRTCSIVELHMPPGRKEDGMFMPHFESCPDAKKWRQS